MSAAFRLSALAMSVTLAACAVGPDFKRPDTATAARFARDVRPATQRDAAPADTRVSCIRRPANRIEVCETTKNVTEPENLICTRPNR